MLKTYLGIWWAIQTLETRSAWKCCKTLDNVPRAIIPQESLDLNLADPCSATNLNWTAAFKSPFLAHILSSHASLSPTLSSRASQTWFLFLKNKTMKSKVLQLATCSTIMKPNLSACQPSMVSSFPPRSENLASPVPCVPDHPPLAFPRLCTNNCLFLGYIFNLFLFPGSWSSADRHAQVFLFPIKPLSCL